MADGKLNPWDYIKSINQSKEYLFSNEEISSREYSPFMVNRGMSHSLAGLPFAEAMDQASHLDSKIQYDFYFFGVPKSHKYTPWVSGKKSHGVEIDKLLEILAEDYQLSPKRALEYIDLLTDEAREELLNMRGGKQNATRTKTRGGGKNLPKDT